MELKQRNNNAPPAYDAKQAKKDALFKIAIKTLSSTTEWRTQVKFTLTFSFISVFLAFYWMETEVMNFEQKALSLLSFALVCYAAVNLSSIVRSREEAKNAMDTQLYSGSTIKTLYGSEVKYYFHWMAFIISFIVNFCLVWYSRMNIERKCFVGICGLLMLSQTFTTVKTSRDIEDAEKWEIDYNSA